MSETRRCAYPVCGRWFTVEPEDAERPMVYPYREAYCSYMCARLHGALLDKRRREVIGPDAGDTCRRGDSGR